MTMYEELNCFEEALKHFGTRVEVICAMELSKRVTSEDAYQMIKDELKEVKKCRKQFNKNENADSLKVIQNEDGSYSLEWDKNDPNWKWLNGLTEGQIQSMIRSAVQHDRNGNL